MTVYNKLVRDKIPEIIRQDGKTLLSRILDQNEYVEALQVKFGEEWAEYIEAADDTSALEELADMLELLYSFARLHGADENALNEVRSRKRSDRGGFSDRIFLIEVADE